MRWILCLLSLLPGTVPVFVPTAAPSEPAVLDRQSALYLEDAIEPRPIARIAAELIAAGGAGGERRLRLAVEAIGAGVDPLPGLAGAPGANLRTAEELDRLLREDALELVVRSAGVVQSGRRTAIDWAPVPVRRIGADGRVEFAAVTAERWPVRVVFESGPLPLGASSCYLEADGVPRLLVEVVGERITAIESRGAEVRR